MDLNDNTILVYAINNYRTYTYIMEEFIADFKKTILIKKSIRKYKTSGVIKDRLLLNNIIIFYNTFNIEAATRILFYKIDKEDYSILKTILIYLNYMPDVVYNINGENIINLDIPIDIKLVKILQSI